MEWRPNPNRDKLSRLRSLCGEKGFDFEKMPGGALKLTRLDIGHVVINGDRLSVAFSLNEAIAYLGRVETE